MHAPVLVTGGTGFVGSHLVRRLAEAGAPVHLVVREGSDRAVLGKAGARVHAHVHDGTLEGMAAIVSAVNPGCVYHLASCFVAEHRPEDVPALIRSNLAFGAQLLEAMAGAGCTRLVNTGTAWQHYGNAAYDPVNLYAATKQAFEDLLAFYAAGRKFRIITLQLFDTYGPGDRRRKLLRVLLDAAASGAPVDMTEGGQRLDLVHVDDVAEAFRLAGDRTEALPAGTHEVYGVATGRPRSLREIVEIFQAARGASVHVRWGRRAYREREAMQPWTGYATLPGWAPRVTLEAGLRTL
ncbi:MAG: NAD(P)-dependent oxidoreductase [Lentisphaerae bacterium]|nr:NAD(P)-dependent oxidoreductase [Lentisphaerota bacterium]